MHISQHRRRNITALLPLARLGGRRASGCPCCADPGPAGSVVGHAFGDALGQAPERSQAQWNIHAHSLLAQAEPARVPRWGFRDRAPRFGFAPGSGAVVPVRGTPCRFGVGGFRTSGWVAAGLPFPAWGGLRRIDTTGPCITLGGPHASSTRGRGCVWSARATGHVLRGAGSAPPQSRHRAGLPWTARCVSLGRF